MRKTGVIQSCSGTRDLNYILSLASVITVPLLFWIWKRNSFTPSVTESCSAWPGISYIDQDNLELVTVLSPLPHKCWDIGLRCEAWLVLSLFQIWKFRNEYLSIPTGLFLPWEWKSAWKKSFKKTTSFYITQLSLQYRMGGCSPWSKCTACYL